MDDVEPELGSGRAKMTGSPSGTGHGQPFQSRCGPVSTCTNPLRM